MNNTAAWKERGIRVAGSIGLIAIVLLGLWGIYQIALYIPGVVGNVSDKASTVFSSTSSSAKETLVLTAPASVQSETPLLVSWKHTGESGAYSYLVSYSCAPGVSFDAPVDTGAHAAVPCNTAFNYTNAKDSLSLIPHLRATSPAAVEISVFANKLSTGSVTSVATSTVVIVPSTSSSGSPTSVARTTAQAPAIKHRAAHNTGVYTAGPKRAALYGLPDLAVRITSIDLVGDHRYNARFTVENIGTNRTPSTWIFSATLPSGYVYTSDPQQTLGPGDRIAFTLGFTDTHAPAVYPQSGCNGVYQTYPCDTVAQPYYSSYANNCGYMTNYTYDGTYNYPSTGYGCTPLPQYQQTYCYTGTCGYAAPAYQPYSGLQTFSVIVDPQQWMQEQNKSNNTASIQF